MQTATVIVGDGGASAMGTLENGGLLGGLLPRASLPSVATGAHWRKNLLRRLSLGLAIYGVLVMVVCLVTHTFFVVLH